MITHFRFWLFLLLQIIVIILNNSEILAQKNSSSSFSPAVRKRRIVNGETAYITDAPFVVQLIRGGSVKCTGSIIADDTIITAAHCAKGGIDSVVYGTCRKFSQRSSSRSIFNQNQNYFRMAKVRQEHVHPSYQSGVDRNDIALLELEEPIPIDYSTAMTTQAINMEPDEGSCGDWVRVYGFGDTHSWFEAHNQRLQTMLTRVENGCYQSEKHRDFIVTQIHGKTVCHGDSGGPLIGNQRRIIGILSGTSLSGCSAGDLNLFVKISNHVEFIEKYFYDKLLRDQQETYKPNTDNSADQHRNHDQHQHDPAHRHNHHPQQPPPPSPGEQQPNWSSSVDYGDLDCSTMERLLNRFRSFRSPFSRRVLQQYETLCLGGKK